MNAMGTPDTDRILVLKGPNFDGFEYHFDIGEQLIGGLNQLDTQTGIKDIGRGHTLMNKTRLRADMFSDASQKRNDIMFDFSFNFVDTCTIKIALFANDFHRFARNDSQLGLTLTGQGFNFKPDFEFILSRPDVGHGRACITFNHNRGNSLTDAGAKKQGLICACCPRKICGRQCPSCPRQ